MEAPDLTARVKDHLRRQRIWCEESLAELDRLLAGLSGETAEEFAARQNEREALLIHLTREHRGLLHEWRQAGHIEEAERAAVRALWGQIETLNEQLRLRYEEAVRSVDRELGANAAAANGLRRGRNMMGKYRPGDTDEPGFIDTKA